MGISEVVEPHNEREASSSACKYETKMDIACWTIRTLLDLDVSNQPERLSALVAHELCRLNIDITALSEVRFPEEGSLKKRDAGYNLYWSEKPRDERCLTGLGFMERDSVVVYC